MYKLSEMRTLGALSSLKFKNQDGSSLVAATRSAMYLKETCPSVSVSDFIVALENEQPTRSVLGAYAMLCVENVLRPMKPSACLTSESLLLPPPIVELPKQAQVLYAAIRARTEDEMPPFFELMLLFARAAVRPLHTRGVMSTLTNLPVSTATVLATDLACHVVLVQAAHGFCQYGSTARSYDLTTLLADAANTAVAKVLGDGCSILTWLHGTDLFLAIKPEQVAASLLKRGKEMTPMDRTPYFVQALERDGTVNANTPCRLVAISSPVQVFNERECSARARKLAAEKRLVLFSLPLTNMGGANAVAATVELLRVTASLRTTAIVTPYAAARRAHHYACAMGYTDATLHASGWNELRQAVLSLADCMGTENVRFKSDCSLLIVDSAHLLDARSLSELLVMACVHPTLRVILVGALSLVPPDPNVMGAAFRDLVHALPEVQVSTLPTLASTVRVDEAMLLHTALTTWKTHAGTPLVLFVSDRPVIQGARIIVAAGKPRLPRTAESESMRRSPEVLHDASGDATALHSTDARCSYLLPWSELAWMSRGELLVLFSHGHSVMIYDDKREARKVPFPAHITGNTEQQAAALASVFAASKFGSFRTTAWELIARHEAAPTVAPDTTDVDHKHKTIDSMEIDM